MYSLLSLMNKSEVWVPSVDASHVSVQNYVGLGFAQGSDLTPACLIALASVRILKH